MIDIKSLIDKHQNIAFLCDSNNQFRLLIENCKENGIVFSKGGSFIEEYDDLYDKYIDHIHDNKPIAIIATSRDKLSQYRTLLIGETQFYSRSLADWDKYIDWKDYYLISYTELWRDDQLNKLLYI